MCWCRFIISALGISPSANARDIILDSSISMTSKIKSISPDHGLLSVHVRPPHSLESFLSRPFSSDESNPNFIHYCRFHVITYGQTETRELRLTSAGLMARRSMHYCNPSDEYSSHAFRFKMPVKRIHHRRSWQPKRKFDIIKTTPTANGLRTMSADCFSKVLDFMLCQP